MAEIGISVAAKLAEYLVDPLVRRARYLFCFNNFVGDLRKAKAELESTLQGVKERAAAAARNAEKIVQPVEKWLNDVEKVLDDVRQLEGRVEASKRCMNVTLRYSVAKQAASMIQRMNELKRNSEIKESFSRAIELPGIKYFSPKDFVMFDSRKSAFDKLMKAIRDDKYSMIGLVGMGGSGKTTLAEQLGNEVQGSNFDKVLKAVVSQNLIYRDIQGQIADQLSYKLEQETELGRAQKLSERLKTERILIVLDDVWKKLDLKAIGIPLNENDNQCNVLLTTRKHEVCTSMGCQSIIELPVLTKNESWTLFKERAQIADDSSEELREVARKVANKCQGLLIAIVTVGSTLRGKDLDWWEAALSRLERSLPIDNDSANPHECLKLSYDNLTNKFAKSLFLLCSMFPEDHKIHMEYLVRFGRGMLQELGTLTDLGTMATTRFDLTWLLTAS